MQNIYLIKDLYPEYINKPYNSIIVRKPNKGGQRFEQIFHKIRYMDDKHMEMCSTSLVTGKYKLKLQLDATTLTLKWLKLK